MFMLGAKLLTGVAAAIYAYKSINPPPPPPPPEECGSPDGPPIRSPRIRSSDGRHVSDKERAKHEDLPVHDRNRSKDIHLPVSGDDRISSGEGKSSVSSLSKVAVDKGRSRSDVSESLGRTNEVVSQNSNLSSSSSILPESSSKPSPSYSNLSTSSPQPPIGSSRPSSSSHEPAVHSSSPSLSSRRVLRPFPNPPPSIPKATTSSNPSIAPCFQESESSSKPATLSSGPCHSSPSPATSSSKLSMPTTASQKISSKSSTPSSKLPPHSKVTLSKIYSNSMGEGEKSNYKWSSKSELPFYTIPKDIEASIAKDIVPEVLKKPLSPTTYKDYFAALLYAEDFYNEKWKNFELVNAALELEEAVIHKISGRNNYFGDNDEKEEKILAAFEIDSVPENRPFLISRDFVFAHPSGNEVLRFQGFVYQVRNSTRLLVEFGEDFRRQHCSTRKYDVSFSFNRNCLKRAHQAIACASDILFQNFLFPDHISRESIAVFPPLQNAMHPDVSSVVHQMLSFQAPPPYLVKGPLCAHKARRSESDSTQLSKTGLAVREALLQIYQRSPACRILVCAPTNRTCDVLYGNLKKYIPEFDMFRANAAFREVDDGEPIGIFSDLYGEEGGCFSIPPLDQLQEFRVIVSTFISSFRLHNEGIDSDHFSHLFLVDASSATEPELMVSLANFANQKTAVVVTGAPGDHPKWVRSDISRRRGLTKSYFERLCESNPYKNMDPRFIKVIEG